MRSLLAGGSALLLAASLQIWASPAARADRPPDAGSWHSRPVNPSGPVDGVASEPPNYWNCTLCHAATGPPNTGDGSVRVSGLPAEYQPGQRYSLEIELEDPQARRWGFELAVLDEDRRQAGTLHVTDPQDTQLSTTSGRQYLKQTRDGTAAGTSISRRWTFDWTAPAAGTGTVFLFASGNAANDDGTISGDFIYNTARAAAEAGSAHSDASLVLQPDDTLPAPGGVLVVRVRVQNHLAGGWTPSVLSQVVLPGGEVYPAPGGFLQATPAPVVLPAGGLGETAFEHFLPLSAPAGSYTYRGYLGVPPASLVDDESFRFEIL